MNLKGIMKEQLVFQNNFTIDLSKNTCHKCFYISFHPFKCDTCVLLLCGNCHKTYKCLECNTGLIYEVRTDLFECLSKNNVMIQCKYCQENKPAEEIESHQNFCQKNMDFISNQTKFDNVDSSDSIVISLDGDNLNYDDEKNKFVTIIEKTDKNTIFNVFLFFPINVSKEQ